MSPDDPDLEPLDDAIRETIRCEKQEALARSDASRFRSRLLARTQERARRPRLQLALAAGLATLVMAWAVLGPARQERYEVPGVRFVERALRSTTALVGSPLPPPARSSDLEWTVTRALLRWQGGHGAVDVEAALRHVTGREEPRLAASRVARTSTDGSARRRLEKSLREMDEGRMVLRALGGGPRS